ncbi:hypothetical protein [Metapseudomonas otitidis]|uniref:Uncharacterized protein n=1 Tax=Metapseudomonas otitidis TaxID=319939 RepID=A0A6S5RQL7_9GAMM|nr:MULTISPECIES: hypothetical protein [Pseudomonas]MDL5598324.1 hypothetical protein [Bacillus subtilis]MBO2930801.1 hypothetical protein [Pseudomonas otitidis]MDG9782003.1 hypothetical protein [Pseudomonas otitidis]MWK58933.1 hypothetical protein [Pseudomonas otitidis]WAF87240.1 hypothetical protein NRL37_07215 [Pseudomonas otitidis]
MAKRHLLIPLLAAMACASQAAEVHLGLGSAERVTRLFAYPNNCNVICYRDWSLEQTVEHYLKQSLARDGLAKASVKVHRDKDGVYANFSGVPADYGKPLMKLLDAGDSAYEGAKRLNHDKQWQYNWYFFLPLGMALENRRSVELLHFPPDYSLTKAQDYLESSTTNRWASLLVVNGVAADATPGYQTIIDIAPIAAPADAGSTLETVYDYFTPYQTRMVQELTAGKPALPMVAFGKPVRDWVKKQYNVSIGVLGLGQIDLGKDQKVPVLGSNHPSYIWYAANPDNYDGDEAKANAAGLKVMGQDLSAACWQAKLGSNPGADPSTTLSSCKQTWQVTNKVQTCELFYTSIRKYDADKAKQTCTAPQG